MGCILGFGNSVEISLGRVHNGELSAHRSVIKLSSILGTHRCTIAHYVRCVAACQLLATVVFVADILGWNEQLFTTFVFVMEFKYANVSKILTNAATCTVKAGNTETKEIEIKMK